MIGNIYIPILTKAVENAKKPSKISVFSDFKAKIYDEPSLDEKSVRVNRHVKDEKPFISVMESNEAGLAKVLAVELVVSKRNIESILVEEMRKLLRLMIDNPGSSCKSKRPKKKYSQGVIVMPHLSEDELIDVMLSKYFEMLGVYTMLETKRSDTYCIFRSNGTIIYSSFEKLFQKVQQEQRKSVFHEVRLLAKEKGFELTDHDINELSHYLGGIINSNVAHLVANPKMNTHDQFMIEAKNLLQKKYGVEKKR